MANTQIFERYGLFGAKVPRYTSYPPANRFLADVGHRHQMDWLKTLPAGDAVSVYVHIPFCRRLCWFCACRTQGTQSLRPVESYVHTLLQELEAVTTALPEGIKMGQLHLGGGTPTLLPPDLMTPLIKAIYEKFDTTEDFEFSVEIDPTEAPDAILDCLVSLGMTRASIGVQDFEPAVQDAIGRRQSALQTKRVIRSLRALGVKSINLDLLYGLPFQTRDTLIDTLQQVLLLNPDRIALYGYAHVPNMSKRQVMIPAQNLPDAYERFDLAQTAAQILKDDGFLPIGIDHFARPDDSMAKAACNGTLRRNFQGYTDDPYPTLIGLGASAISRLPQGYLQNAVSTAAYSERVTTGGLAGYKGVELSHEDQTIGEIIEQIMCFGTIAFDKFPEADRPQVMDLCRTLNSRFPDAVTLSPTQFSIHPDAIPLTRIIAGAIDTGFSGENRHSLAI